MAYVDSDLGGPNAPSKARANLLAEHISTIVSKKPAMLNDPNVFFTFSYCFNDKDAPVFGQPPRIWSQDLFMYFIKQLKICLCILLNNLKQLCLNIQHFVILEFGIVLLFYLHGLLQEEN
jgi:hypothetical protein